MARSVTARSVTDQVPFGANAMRLSLRQWTVVAVIVLLFVLVVPIAWTGIESWNTTDDYRIPYGLSDDYWQYQRFVGATANGSRKKILAIGDSVIWGEYVTPDKTLSQHLNQLAGRERFANGGANGTHPLALEGLVRYYARDVRDASVLLHCNLLWMSSPERDLSSTKELSFNHPRLVPQLYPRIPCYRATINERLGIVVDRGSTFRSWVHHLRIAYFDSQSIPDWTLEHPLENPLGQVTLKLPGPKNLPHSEPVAWTARPMKPQDIPWVPLDKSLQWQAFQRTVRLLYSRGNRLYVVINPFNEHMLAPASEKRYRLLKGDAESWLQAEDVPYDAPPVLPSAEYADASHPLSAGYARLARRLLEQESFQDWLVEE